MKEEELKHLEFIQAVITRMANNSFMLKGWSIAILTGLFAISIVIDNKFLSFLPIIPIMAFWGLDTYYLRQERLFRKLYDFARKSYLHHDSSLEIFCMDTRPYNKDVDEWSQVLFSKSIIWFYGPIGFVVLIIIYTISA